MIRNGGQPRQQKMSYVYAEITIIALTILQICAPIPANNTTDKNGKPQSTLQANECPIHFNEAQLQTGSTPSFLGHRLVKRCWNSVISGRPTLAKVIIAGSFFIVTALGFGLSLFFHIYCRHKEELAEIEQELLTGKRCFKPQLEDLETGLLSMHITKPVSFMKTGLSSKFRRRKESDDDKSEDDSSEEDDESKEEDEYGDVQNENETVEKFNIRSLGGMFKTPVRKKTEQLRESEDSEDERHQAHGEDLKKTRKSKGKPKGKELEKKGKRDKTEKGEEDSKKSDPMKKPKKLWGSLVPKKKDLKKKEASNKDKKKAAGKKKDKAKKGKKSNFKALKEKLKKKKKQVKKVKKQKKIKIPKLKKIKIKKKKK